MAHRKLLANRLVTLLVVCAVYVNRAMRFRRSALQRDQQAAAASSARSGSKTARAKKPRSNSTACPNAALLGAYTAGFMKNYPFIKAEFWRGSGNKLVFRTLDRASHGPVGYRRGVGRHGKRHDAQARGHLGALSFAGIGEFRQGVHRQGRLLACRQFGRVDDRLQYQAGAKRRCAERLRRSFRSEVERQSFHRHGTRARR